MLSLGLLLLVAGPTAPGVSGASGPVGTWDSSYSQTYFEVEIPADAGLSGPAEAWLEQLRPDSGPYAFAHKVRFTIKAGVPTRVRVSTGFDTLTRGVEEPRVAIVVETSAGKRWARSVDFETRAASLDGVRLIGTPEHFSQLNALLRQHAPMAHLAEQLLATMTVTPWSRAGDHVCRDLHVASRTIAVIDPAARAEQMERLAKCTALGARVVVIDPNARDAFNVEPGRPLTWGAGTVVWWPALDAAMAAGLFVLQFEQDAGARAGMQPYASANNMSGLGWNREWFAPSPESPSTLLIFLLLGVYVLVIGPVGYFVSVKPRNTVTTWLWFPGVALSTCAICAVLAQTWDQGEARVSFGRVQVLAPNGVGLERTYVKVQGQGRASVNFTWPWADADLVELQEPSRFGSPFTSAGHRLSFVEDQNEQTMRFSGISVGRFTSATGSWAQPVHVDVPRFMLRGEDLVVVNDTDTRIERGLVIFSEKEAAVPALDPGQSATLERRASTPPDYARQKKWSWIDTLRSQLGPGAIPEQHALLAVELAPRADVDVQVEPALPASVSTLRLVAGPLPKPSEDSTPATDASPKGGEVVP